MKYVRFKHHQERETNKNQVTNLLISSIGFFDIFLHPAKAEKNRI